MFVTGVTMGLAEWIIDDTCLLYFFTVLFFEATFQNVAWWKKYNITESKHNKLDRWPKLIGP